MAPLFHSFTAQHLHCFQSNSNNNNNYDYINFSFCFSSEKRKNSKCVSKCGKNSVKNVNLLPRIKAISVCLLFTVRSQFKVACLSLWLLSIEIIKTLSLVQFLRFNPAHFYTYLYMHYCRLIKSHLSTLAAKHRMFVCLFALAFTIINIIVDGRHHHCNPLLMFQTLRNSIGNH